MTAHHDQSLLIRKLFQIFFDQSVLHPVLADLSGFPIGYQFVRIQGYIKVQVVIDHHLQCFAFDTFSLVFVYWLAVQLSLRAEAIPIDTASFFQFLGKLPGHLRMMIGVNIAECVLYSHSLIMFAEMCFSFGRPANTFFKSRIFRQHIVQLDGHGFINGLVHSHVSLSLLGFLIYYSMAKKKEQLYFHCTEKYMFSLL